MKELCNNPWLTVKRRKDFQKLQTFLYFDWYKMKVKLREFVEILFLQKRIINCKNIPDDTLLEIIRRLL